MQVQRLLIYARNVGVLAVLVAGGIWAWRQTQSDERFAVRTIEIDGAKHTPRAALDQATQRYVGLNLFQIDIDRVQRDLGGLGWVRRIDIEKKVPDTLRIKITERTPVALARIGERLMYVDAEGAAFAELSPSVGDDDLPLIADAQGAELHAQRAAPAPCCGSATASSTRASPRCGRSRRAASRCTTASSAPWSTRTRTTSPRSTATSTQCCAPKTTRRSNTRTFGSRIE